MLATKRLYVATVIDAKNVTRDGEVEAASPEEAAAKLKRNGLTMITCRLKHPEPEPAASNPPAPRSMREVSAPPTTPGEVGERPMHSEVDQYTHEVLKRLRKNRLLLYPVRTIASGVVLGLLIWSLLAIALYVVVAGAKEAERTRNYYDNYTTRPGDR
jgi:hypothetical protein